METDGVIIERVIAGEHDVYGKLVQRYGSAVETRVRKYVRKRSIAKQLANDVFTKGFLKLKTLRDNNCFRAWISRLADREAIDYQRKCNRDRRLVSGLAKVGHLLSQAEMNSRSGPELLEQKERLERLSRAILELKPQDQEIIELRYFAGKSTKEIGQELGRPDGTIRSQLHRCHLKLYQKMRGYDYVEKV